MSMGKQEIFNKAITHLRKQGRRAMRKDEGGNDTCAYRAPNGDMCAIGCLIPDEEYSEDFEKRSASEICDSVSTLKDADRLFLNSLQSLHDESKYWTERGIKEGDVQLFAEEFGLEVPA